METAGERFAFRVLRFVGRFGRRFLGLLRSLSRRFLVLFGRRFFGFGRLGRNIVRINRSADGKADAVLFRIDRDDLHLDLIANLQDRSGIGDHFIRNLRIVDQTVHTGNDFRKRTERHQ